MKQLEVMPNLMKNVQVIQEHIIPLSPACPVSGNPKQGSELSISYEPKAYHLEVYSLRAFVDQFSGGLPCPHSGNYIVRDQEHMIQYIAQECSDTLGVDVTVIANLILSDGVSVSKMRLTCTATNNLLAELPKISSFSKK